METHTDPLRYNESVAARIADELRRSNRAERDLAAALGWSRMYLNRRMRSEVEFTLGDIEQVAGVLGVSRQYLLEAPIPKAES